MDAFCDTIEYYVTLFINSQSDINFTYLSNFSEIAPEIHKCTLQILNRMKLYFNCIISKYK